MDGTSRVKETILQFGAGNFLRGFVDVFVDEMNRADQDIGKVVVVQSTGGDRAQLLNAGTGYHVLVRGIESGEPVERVQRVESISRALVASSEWEAVLEVARSPHLRAIVSNTTEAGLVLDDADKTAPLSGQSPVSFPARLLAILHARHESGQPGVTILPCELVENNALYVRSLVQSQADLWQWNDPGFCAWLRDDCTWANTLVDRIVSGKPDAHPLLESDPLLTVAETFQFWAVEDHPGTAFLNHPAIVRVPDVSAYSLRKVRILNGAHTALVAYCRKYRPEIRLVREALADPEIAAWQRGLIFEEIVPTIADRVPNADGYARQVLDRFANPYLDHRLEAIALHHDTKVQVRLIPTFNEYRAKFGKDPARLSSVLPGQG